MKNSKKQNKLEIEYENIQDFHQSFLTKLDKNPEFSLEVDPLNKYNMSAQQKTFIRNYIEFKNIAIASEMTNIDIQLGKSYFIAFSSQQEIRRINRALYQRQFGNKLLTVDEIGGWLSALLTDEVPMADRITKPTDKLTVARMLIDINNLKNQAINSPELILDKDFDDNLKQLSVENIKELLYSKDVNKEKEELIKSINKDNLFSLEEITYLKTLSLSELQQFVNSINEPQDNTNYQQSNVVQSSQKSKKQSNQQDSTNVDIQNKKETK